MDSEQLFLDHLPYIDRVADVIARRNGMSREDREDFGAAVRARLIADDYAVMRKFRGESAMTTFLTVVITNAFRDYRTSKWGRWRPSAAAHRLGGLAVRLETLLHRDGYPLHEAIQVLRTSDENVPADATLARLAASLPERTTVVMTGVQADGIAATETADGRVIRVEMDEARGNLERSLVEGLRELAPEDQMIVRLHFWEAMTIAEIARTLKLDQKPLYRRLERCLHVLRTRLENRGIDRKAVAAYFSGLEIE